MISSAYDSETSLAMGMLRMAQRWCGLSHPVNMMNTSQLRLLQPVDSTAPQAVHLIAELRELGCKLVVGWVSRPCAESTIAFGSGLKSLRLCAREWAECCVRRGAVCGQVITSGTAACCVQCANWGAQR